jgi:putative membrane protein
MGILLIPTRRRKVLHPQGEYPMNKMLISMTAAALALAGTQVTVQAQALATTPARAAVRALDDPTIVAIFDAANSWDIETSQVALKKSKNKDVLAFAGMMVKDHTAVRKIGRDLVAKLKVTPTPPGKDFPLAVDHADAMKKLASATGAAFDKEYIDHEVWYHQAVIDAVTKQLLPATQNAEVRDLENKVAPNFVAHLAAGKAVQAKLK